MKGIFRNARPPTCVMQSPVEVAVIPDRNRAQILPKHDSALTPSVHAKSTETLNRQNTNV